jgi:predicted nucleic acid-binding protein
MAPPVLAELRSKPWPSDLEALFSSLIQLPLEEGYWERAGRSRALILGKGLRARLADTLVAQCCIDADVPLIARDPDFRHFATHCGLKLA